MSTVLSTRGLAKTYVSDGIEVLALRGIDLDVAPGELVAVMGPSGSGKSTLLHLLGGFDRPTAGTIELDGRAVEGLSERDWAILRRTRIGFVFQFFALVENLTVAENVELPARLVGATAAEARARRRELLDQLDVSARAEALPSQLSGGQHQRVALARALVNRPAVLLADEPTGNRDRVSAAEIVSLLRRLRDDGQTVVLVTHDARVASAADRVVSMRDGLVVDETALSDRAEPSAVLSQLLQLEA
jgi:putative ABC transport system ATP-binding protein